MGRTADYSRQVCSIAATLEVVGDPWTLLILRDAFAGVHRFDQWQENLGLARNVLAARLKSLVGHGVLARHPYSDHPPRCDYLLTDKGKDLLGVLVTMGAWGDRHLYGAHGGPVSHIHEPCGQTFTPAVICQACGEPVRAGELALVMGEETTTVGELLAEIAGPTSKA